jgi:hypothetical protein
MCLENAKKLYPNEWIAFRSSSHDEDPEGEVVFHHPDRNTFESELLAKKIVNVYLTYTGELVKEGYSVLF